LDRDRPAELVAQSGDLLDRLDGVGRAGDDRDAGGAHRLAGRRLRAHQLDGARRRADPDEPGALARTREGCVLGQETVARVHGLGARAQRGLDDPFLDEVALGGRARADQVRLVGDPRMECAAVDLGVDRHRGASELPQRAEDPDGDFAAVCHEHFREHGHRTHILLNAMTPADQLTAARVLAVPFVILLYTWDFPGHAYWATGVFIVAMATDQFDGWLARRQGRTTPLGSLLDPVADKILVLSVLIVLVDADVFRGWMVALIVARELLISGLRLAAVERGVVVHA